MTIRKALTWALLAAFAVGAFALFAACGDDDSGRSVSNPGGGGSTNGGTGSDAQYVSAVCKAANKFTDDLSTASKDPSKLSDPTALANAFQKPLEDYLAALKQAKPPSDVKQFHDALVKALDDALASLKKSTIRAPSRHSATTCQRRPRMSRRGSRRPPKTMRTARRPASSTKPFYRNPAIAPCLHSGGGAFVVVPARAYRPSKRGSRFSMNDRTPSLRSKDGSITLNAVPDSSSAVSKSRFAVR